MSSAGCGAAGSRCAARSAGAARTFTEVREHARTRRRDERAEPAVVDRRQRGKRVEPAGEERLAFVDVADAGERSLIEERVADWGVAECSQAAASVVDVEALGEDVRTERRECLVVAGMANGADHRGAKDDGDRLGNAYDERGEPGRTLPSLARAIKVNAPMHPEVNAQRRPSVEVDEEVLSPGFDRRDARSPSGHVRPERARRADLFDRASCEDAVEGAGDTKERIALRHRRTPSTNRRRCAASGERRA
jgi:hypothetical protein